MLSSDSSMFQTFSVLGTPLQYLISLADIWPSTCDSREQPIVRRIFREMPRPHYQDLQPCVRRVSIVFIILCAQPACECRWSSFVQQVILTVERETSAAAGPQLRTEQRITHGSHDGTLRAAFDACMVRNFRGRRKHRSLDTRLYRQDIGNALEAY